jgi:hypothetical protein
MCSFFETLMKANDLVTVARARGNVNQVSKALGLQSAALEAYTWSLNHRAEVEAEHAAELAANTPDMVQGELL